MKKIGLIITGIIITLALGVGAFFGAKIIYNNGIAEGRQEESNEMSDKLRVLGNAVSEKESFQKSVNNLFDSFPAELNSEGIDSYIEKLSDLINSLSTEKVKDLLNEYLNKWQDFKKIYASENNGEITERFNQLKTQTEELSSKIKTVFDESIKESLENL